MNLDSSRALGLSKHADFKTRRDGYVLVLPERAIRIGGSGAEILRLVEQGRSARFVLTEMGDRYPDSPDVAAEVPRFLEEMLSLGGILYLEDGLEHSA